MSAPVPRILLVEDNPSDAQLMRIAFAEKLPGGDLRLVEDGEEALATLLEPGGADQRPDLVLLDLNLPRLNGHEVLATVRGAADAGVRRLPVVILSTSDALADVQRSYELFASSHMAKPHDIDELFEAVETLVRYWFTTVALP
jgi:two-component system response regulator